MKVAFEIVLSRAQGNAPPMVKRRKPPMVGLKGRRPMKGTADLPRPLGKRFSLRVNKDTATRRVLAQRTKLSGKLFRRQSIHSHKDLAQKTAKVMRRRNNLARVLKTGDVWSVFTRKKR